MTRNVFAGKAVIAELRGTGTGIGDMVTWKTSDPASGTEVSYRNDGTANTGFVSGQVEPLGQSVALTDPEPPNEPQTYEQHLFFASEPEWQCSVPDAFYGGFQGRPDHCQNRLVYIDHAEALFSPLSLGKMAVPTLVDSPLSLAGSGPTTAYASNAMRYALRSSDKEKEANFCPPGTVPMRDANGEIQCVGTGVTEVLVNSSDEFPDVHLERRPEWGLVAGGVLARRASIGELELIKHEISAQVSESCLQYINKLLSATGGTPFSSLKDMTAEVDKIANARNTRKDKEDGFWMYAEKTGGSTADTNFLGLGFYVVWDLNSRNPALVTSAVFKVIHELIHTRGAGDTKLASAALGFKGLKLNLKGLSTDAATTVASSTWDNQMTQNCGQPSHFNQKGLDPYIVPVTQ